MSGASDDMQVGTQTDLRRLDASLVSLLSLGTAVLMSVVLGACTDQDPFGLQDWTANPDTAVIYSLSLDDLNLITAFDFTERAGRPVAVRDEFGRFNQWDVALDVVDGAVVLLAQDALGVQSEAAVAEIPNRTFDQVIEAPADTALYQSRSGVVLRSTSVYIVRTRKVTRQSFFTSQCNYYAKVQPLRIDPAAGVFEFLYDVNVEFSGCNNRDLVPPNP